MTGICSELPTGRPEAYLHAMPDSDPWYLKHFSKDAAQAAYTLRVSRDPILALRALATLAQEIEKGTHQCVHDCRERGHSWNEIAEALSVTKQAAHRRYHDDE